MAVAPSWIERHCVVPDGFRRGEPFRLYDYQLRFFAAFYTVRDDAEWVPENPVLAPAFRYRMGLLVGPQKLGKGPHTAAHTCLEAVGPAVFAGWAGTDDGYVCKDWGCGCGWEYPYDPGEPRGMPWPTPLIQITAYSEEQTRNVFDVLRPMIEYGPLADVIPKTGEEFIRLPGGGRIDTVTSSAQSRLGQRVTFVPQDEVGIWTPQNKMTKVADTQYRGLAGMGGRAALSTNAWDPSENSVAQTLYESPDRDLWRQFVQPPSELDYRDPVQRRQIHELVYPADTWRVNGGHVDLDAIDAEAASLANRDLPQAMRFFGNILAKGARKAVDPARWDLLRVDGVLEDGAYVGLGFDGSESDDHTVLVASTLDDRQELIGWWDPADYPDGLVPRLEVEAAVDAAFKRFRVGRMLMDRRHWENEAVRWARRHGDDVVLILPQNLSRMGPATAGWLEAVDQGLLGWLDGVHGSVFREHVVSAHAKTSEHKFQGQHWPLLTKGDDRRKIDAVVAAVMAKLAAAEMPELDDTPTVPLVAWR